MEHQSRHRRDPLQRLPVKLQRRLHQHHRRPNRRPNPSLRRQNNPPPRRNAQDDGHDRTAAATQRRTPSQTSTRQARKYPSRRDRKSQGAPHRRCCPLYSKTTSTSMHKPAPHYLPRARLRQAPTATANSSKGYPSPNHQRKLHPPNGTRRPLPKYLHRSSAPLQPTNRNTPDLTQPWLATRHHH